MASLCPLKTSIEAFNSINNKVVALNGQPLTFQEFQDSSYKTRMGENQFPVNLAYRWWSHEEYYSKGPIKFFYNTLEEANNQVKYLLDEKGMDLISTAIDRPVPINTGQYVVTIKKPTAKMYQAFNYQHLNKMEREYNREGNTDTIISDKILKENSSFQIEANNIPSDKELDAQLTNWLKKLGITVENLETITDENGQPLPVTALNSMLQKLVQVVEGKAGQDTLPEEAAHIALRLAKFKSPILHKRIMQQAAKSEMLKKVTEDYNDLYQGDEARILEETAGKLIAQEVLKLWGKYNSKYITESEQLSKGINNLWNKVMQWFKGMFRVAGITTKATSAVSILANDMLSNREATFSNIDQYLNTEKKELITVLYQMSPEQRVNTADLIKAIKETSEYIVYDKQTKQYFNKKTNKPIVNRASDIVSVEKDKRFGDAAIQSSDNFNAKKGTAIHAYCEHIMQAILNNTTPDYIQIKTSIWKELIQQEEFASDNISFIELSEKQFNHIVSKLKELHTSIQQRQKIVNRQTGVEETPTILSEHTIYSTEKDMAGTVDLMVIYSNGVIDIFDYKSINLGFNEVSQSYTPVSNYKKEFYNLQLNTYKDILYTGYGADQFAALRIIPINVQFSKGGQFSVKGYSEVEVGFNNRSGVDMIALTGDRTLYPKLNETIDRIQATIFDLQNRLNKKPGDEALQTRIEQYEKQLEDIRVYTDFSSTISYLQTINALIDQKSLIPINTNGYLSHSEIQTYLNFVSSLENIGTVLEEVANNKYGKNSSRYRENRKLAPELQFLVNEIRQKLLQSAVNLLDYNENNSVLDVSTEVGFMGKMFNSLSEQERPVFQRLYQYRDRAGFAANQETLALLKEIETEDKKLETWAKQQGLSKQQAFLKLVNTNTGNLISRYTKALYEDLHKALKGTDPNGLSWVLKYTLVTQDKEGKFSYVGEAATKFKEARQRKLDSYLKTFATLKDGKIVVDQKSVDKAMAFWDHNYNIEVSNEAFNSRNPYIRLNTENLEEYTADEWKYIDQHSELKAYYEFFQNKIKEYKENTGYDLPNLFIPNIRTSIIESISKDGFKVVSNVWSTIKNVLYESSEIREDENISSKVSTSEEVVETELDPITGEKRLYIPLYHTSAILGDIQNKDIEQLKLSPELEGETPGSIRYEKKLSNLIYKTKKQKGLEYKSYDLSRNLAIFGKQAILYSYLSDIEDTLRNLAQIITDKELTKTLLTTSSGKTIIGKISKKVLTFMKISAEDEQYFKDMLNAVLYGQVISGKDRVIHIGRKYDNEGKMVEEGKPISLTKVGLKAMRLVSMAMLGLKPILGFGALTQNTSSLDYLARDNVYFSKKSLKEGYVATYKDFHKTIALFKQLGLSSRELELQINKLAASKGNKRSIEDYAYIFIQTPDKLSELVTLNTMFTEYGVNKDGKIVKVSKDTTSTPLISLVEYNKEAQEVTFKGLNTEQLRDIRTKIFRVFNRVKGTRHEYDLSAIDTKLLYKLLFQYRNWIPGLAKARFGSLKYDPVFENVDVGRLTVLLNEITSTGTNRIKVLTNLLAHSIPIFGDIVNSKQYVNEKAAKIMYEKFKAKYPKSNYTYEEFIELYKNKIKSATSEIRYIVLFAMLSMLAFALKPEWDIPEEQMTMSDKLLKWQIQTAYRALNRAYSELSFFVDISSALDIIKSPLPILGYVNNVFGFMSNTVDETRDLLMNERYSGGLLWKPQSKDKQPIGYYSVRLVPGLGGVVDFLDIYDNFSEKSK